MLASNIEIESLLDRTSRSKLGGTRIGFKVLQLREARDEAHCASSKRSNNDGLLLAIGRCPLRLPWACAWLIGTSPHVSL